jgi:hypothetical protein
MKYYVICRPEFTIRSFETVEEATTFINTGEAGHEFLVVYGEWLGVKTKMHFEYSIVEMVD